jgi:hypothetical protein
VGNIIVISLPKTNFAGRYVAMFMLCLGSYCAFNCKPEHSLSKQFADADTSAVSFAWVTSTIPRPKVKRAAALSLVNGLANASHFFRLVPLYT